MNDLNSRIDRLRHTRIAVRAAIKAAYADPDPGYRAQKLQAATLALRSTDAEWDQLLEQQAARSDRVNLAQVKHQISSTVRRSVPGYVTRDLRPGR